jgi:Tol biopolymer transport system component
MAAGQEWTRRAMLSSWAALTARAASPEKSQAFPSERVRFADRATEFLVLRLTDPSHSCFLPACYGRAVSRHSAFLLYWSDRTGSPQGFRMNLKTGESQQVTAAHDLDGSSLALLPDDRGFCYFDGPSLRLVTLSNLREREVYRVPDGSTRGPGFSVAPDGSRALLVEIRDGMSQLRQVGLPRGGAKTLRGSSVPLAHPLVSPQGDAILCREGAESLSVIRQDGREGRRIALAPGRTGPAFWSPDGRTVLYLNLPAEPGKLNSIRESDAWENTDRLVSPTSQFASFSPNSDASVFAGASASRASPYVLILLRRTRRELTICEHLANDPARVAPRFSPDSRQIFYQSDRHGKPAIYCVPVERLVEPTSGV